MTEPAPSAASGGGPARPAGSVPSGGGLARPADSVPSGGDPARPADSVPSGGGPAPSGTSAASGGGPARPAGSVPSGGGPARPADSVPSGGGAAPSGTSAEPARRLSPGARWVWGVHQALVWLALLVLARVFGGRLWGGLWLLPLVGLLTGPLLVSVIRWRRWRWDVGEEGIDIRHGTLTVRRTLIPWIRVQHVDTRRGVVEQMFDLATVVVHTAAGAHEIPLLDSREAEVLRERIGALARRDD